MNDSHRLSLNFVLGTAAELIKVYPVIHLAREKGHRVRIISTGQSRDNFLMQYADLHLDQKDLMMLAPSAGDLGQASSALKWFFKTIFSDKNKFKNKLLREGKSFVVVHGDTLSTLVGAWLAKRCGIPVVHIEAGLRSPRLFNPFPEEITRRLVSRFVTIHMAPDERAVQNLVRARVGGHIVCTQGNTLQDAIFASAPLQRTTGNQIPFALVNIHRFENLNSSSRWQKIIEVLLQAAKKTKLIFIVHPQMREKLKKDAKAFAELSAAQIEFRDRLPFTEFVRLLKSSQYLISDGGSNQEECSYLGKPCLILREKTERLEGLDGCCVLSEFDSTVTEEFLRDPSRYQTSPIIQEHGPSGHVLNFLEGPG